MPKAIDWRYARASCDTCKKAAAFTDDLGVRVKASRDGVKERLEGAAALTALDGVSTLVVVRGKKVETLDLKANRPADDELLAKLLGPTGNLRAPTVRVGKTLIVGFTDEVYRTVLGG